MKDKTRQIREMNFSSIERKKVFEAKQRIAVEKFGNMFEDDTFFQACIACPLFRIKGLGVNKKGTTRPNARCNALKGD